MTDHAQSSIGEGIKKCEFALIRFFSGLATEIERFCFVNATLASSVSCRFS